MKKYICFAIDQYYPAGGMNDALFLFNTQDEFDKLIEEKTREYQPDTIQLWNCETCNIMNMSPDWYNNTDTDLYLDYDSAIQQIKLRAQVWIEQTSKGVR